MLPASNHSVLLLFLVEVVQPYFDWQPTSVSTACEPTATYACYCEYVVSVAVVYGVLLGVRRLFTEERE